MQLFLYIIFELYSKINVFKLYGQYSIIIGASEADKAGNYIQ